MCNLGWYLNTGTLFPALAEIPERAGSQLKARITAAENKPKPQLWFT